MGACTSSPKNQILCNRDGNIIHVTQDLLIKLRYDLKNLEGQFIGILMSDFMSMLHSKYFIHMFNNTKGVEKNRLENKLKNLHHKRPLIIYDIDKKAYHVSVSVRKAPSPDILEIQFEFIHAATNLFYTDALSIPRDSVFRINTKDAIIIMTDFIKSTKLLHDKGVAVLIDTSVRFHAEISNLIRDKYYPFVYMHEMVGDSFVLALNADWTYNTQFCATLAMNFMFDLIQKTREFVKIRTGIGYGKIRYGYVGSLIRFFGFPLNMAARLENKCGENQILMCKDFHNKLMGELKIISSYTRTECSECEADLKGFGKTTYYMIPVSESKPFVIY